VAGTTLSRTHELRRLRRVSIYLFKCTHQQGRCDKKCVFKSIAQYAALAENHKLMIYLEFLQLIANLAMTKDFSGIGELSY